MMRGIVKERLTFPEKYRGDFLYHAIEDMKTEKFLTEDFIVQLIFGILFGTFEPISAVVVLTFKLLSEHPSTLEELTVRIDSDSFIEKLVGPSCCLVFNHFVAFLTKDPFFRRNTKKSFETERMQIPHSHGMNTSR